MSSNSKVFVSPGVYTSEKDLSTVTRNVGVTSLGLVGETLKGPAFQPIIINSFNEFKTFFGGVDATKVSSTGYPKYELPYIASSYLKDGGILYVTKVLGLSGYDAGNSWAITADNDQVIAVLRSKANYDSEDSLNFEIENSGDLVIDPSNTGVTENIKADFVLSGTSLSSGSFAYNVSLDSTKKNYITRVLGTTPNSGQAPIYVEEIYKNMLESLITNSAVSGLSINLIENGTRFSDYKSEYKSSITPWIVSEVNGSIIKKLFRFTTISDGKSANSEIKISIENIKPDDREFDVRVRAFNDTDANPVTLERFSRCTMDPTSDNFIGRRIGTLDGFYSSNSNYVLVELSDDDDTSSSFPAGFTGVPARIYTGGKIAPSIEYNKSYSQFAKVRKIYLGISDTVGIDQNFFNYLGADNTVNSGVTKGFHMDIDASGATLDNYTFEYGDSQFQTDAQLSDSNNSYNKVFSRKFTLAPYGGFDGWDVYRNDERTNTDSYVIGATKSTAALSSTAIKTRITSDGEQGTTADYYAFLEGIKTFKNPESININVFATPGIDILNNTNLVEDAIEMVEEERSDSIYIVTTPDYENDEIIDIDDLVSRFDATGIDSNYTATYWPWIQVNDTENNVLIYLPPTRDVCRNIALTDKVTFPWFAVAGVERGIVDGVKARKRLTLSDRETLYENRINPIVTFPSPNLVILGNKNLQVKDSALNRISVRRLLLQARKLISAVSLRLLFEQNDEIVREEFKSLVNPILQNIKSERGLTDFRVEVDSSPEAIDRGELNGRIFIKPTRALEYITVEFVVMNTGASFEDV